MRLNGILACTLLAAAIALHGAGVVRAQESEAQLRTLAPETAHGICEEVLTLANAGQLETRLIDVSRGILLDYDGDGSPNRLRIEESLGTCPNRDLVDWDRRNPDGSLDLSYEGFSSREIGKDEALRWAHWGSKDYFLFVQEEPVVVAANFWQTHVSPKVVYWFGNGQRRPVCSFEFTGEILDRTIAGPDRLICDAISSGSFQAPPIGAEMNMPHLNNPDGSTNNAVDGLRIFSADLDGDGRAENLGHSYYEHGGGCGFESDSLVELEADGLTTTSSPISTALSTLEWRNLNWRRDAPSSLPLVALYRDDAYILARTPFGGVGAYSIENGQSRLRCEIDRTRQFRILQEYPTAL